MNNNKIRGPMISYFGAKWRAAPKYPPPKYGTIVEPFAGGAGYSLRYADRDVILVEKEPRLAAMWKWLTTTTKDEIMDLPLEITDLREMDLRPEAKTLIGFWINRGVAAGCKTPSAWMRSGQNSPGQFWGDVVRSRISDSVGLISHWTIIDRGYESAPDIEATWFIDPPYQLAGKNYPCGSRSIDFAVLGSWCKARRGQVMVCENVGADWLPFLPFAKIKSMESKNGKGTSAEAIWYRETEEP